MWTRVRYIACVRAEKKEKGFVTLNVWLKTLQKGMAFQEFSTIYFLLWIWNYPFFDLLFCLKYHLWHLKLASTWNREIFSTIFYKFSCWLWIVYQKEVVKTWFLKPKFTVKFQCLFQFIFFFLLLYIIMPNIVKCIQFYIHFFAKQSFQFV